MCTFNIFLLGLCIVFLNKDIKFLFAILDVHIHISIVYKSQKTAEACVALTIKYRISPTCLNGKPAFCLFVFGSSFW